MVIVNLFTTPHCKHVHNTCYTLSTMV